MNHEQQAVQRDADCGLTSAISNDDWHALEWQLMGLALDAAAEGARS